MSKEAQSMFKDESGTYTLWAGQNIDVGEVIVTNAGDVITVEYLLDANGWRIEGTHLHADYDWKNIPQTKKGNPKVGHFQYKETFDPGVQSYAVTLDETYDDCFYIAAHADVVYDPLIAFEDALPAAASLNVANWGPFSYFGSTITNGGMLNGFYVGWCIDVGHFITPGTTYPVTIYSSYEDISGISRIDYPENFDKINYIINQGYVGQPSGCDGAYNKADVQRAIWVLIDETPSGVGNCRVDEILAEANLYGEGFIPGCGDLIAVIVAPVNAAKQVSMIEVEFAAWVDDCEGSGETAWAEGYDFPGNSWAMYFGYCPID